MNKDIEKLKAIHTALQGIITDTRNPETSLIQKYASAIVLIQSIDDTAKKKCTDKRVEHIVSPLLQLVQDADYYLKGKRKCDSKIAFNHLRGVVETARIEIAELIAELEQEQAAKQKDPGQPDGGAKVPDDLNVCSVCGWIHDDEFTSFTNPHDDDISYCMKGKLQPLFMTVIHDNMETGTRFVSVDKTKEKTGAEPFDIFKGNHDAYRALIDDTRRGFRSIKPPSENNPK